MKAIGFSLEVEDSSDINHEDFMRRLIAKSGPRNFFATYRVISNQMALNFGML